VKDAQAVNVAIRLKSLWKTYARNARPAVKDTVEGGVVYRQTDRVSGGCRRPDNDADLAANAMQAIPEGARVCLNVRPEGHSAWQSDW
jgi:hypothetical protein